MHHAFPRECPYPHVSGTTSQQTPDEYIAETGMESETATEQEMLQFVMKAHDMPSATSPDLVAVEELLHWSTEEELLVVRQSSQVISSSTSATVRSLMFLIALGAFAYATV